MQRSVLQNTNPIFCGREYASRIKIKAQFQKNQMISVVLVIKTIPHIYFFHRNMDRKLYLLKGWRRKDRKQLLVLLFTKKERMNRNEGGNCS